MNLQAARSNVLEIKEILDNLHVKFWLRAGTLLGAVREKNFIPYDLDADLTMLAEDWNPLLCKKFLAQGFRCENLRHRIYSSPIQRFALRKGSVKTDVMIGYYYSPENVYVFITLHPVSSPVTITPAKFYKGECFIKFLGQDFRVPNPPEKYLEKTYGENWRIRDRTWKWSKVRPRIGLNKYLEWIQKHLEKEQLR